MRDLLASPMVVIDPLDETPAAEAGDLVEGRDLDPDISATQVITSAQARDWPVLAAHPRSSSNDRPRVDRGNLPGTP
jgi:hypothetical protein